MITLTDVSRIYQSNTETVRALDAVSLTIADEEFLSIAGPSGSGKTTLLNLIGLIDAPDTGEIILAGRSTSSLNASERAAIRRHEIGFIFQTYNLIPVLTAEENIAFALQLLSLPTKEISERVDAILEEVGLAGLGNRLPSELSGGQQQRVAIARALIKEPKMILADEPTANLDSKTGEEILSLMRSINERRGTLCIFSTHDPMVMEYARRLITLHDGQVATDEVR
ncbi:MAG TPA: ABC transporter ATP-binding protein [Sphaerochaeta sp.]|nr:ABC transporter ATP-binding protein [Sphaerochaeta sp.]